MITLNKCSILVTIYIILNTFEYMIKIKDIFKIKSEDEFELMDTVHMANVVNKMIPVLEKMMNAETKEIQLKK